MNLARGAYPHHKIIGVDEKQVTNASSDEETAKSQITERGTTPDPTRTILKGRKAHHHRMIIIMLRSRARVQLANKRKRQKQIASLMML